MTTKFQKGKSGNPNGRPSGVPNKKTLLINDLAEHGLAPSKMLAQVYAMSIKNAQDAAPTDKPKFLEIALKCTQDALKFSYTPPAPEVESQLTVNVNQQIPLTTEELRAQIDERGLSGIIKLDD